MDFDFEPDSDIDPDGIDPNILFQPDHGAN
jgi:hypothetical protein